jgi:hypothetical protein
MVTPLRWSASSVLSIVSVLAACSSSPTSNNPPALTCPSAAVPLCSNATQAAAIKASAADATTRLLPSLSTSTRTQVSGPLGDLQTALQAGDVTASRTAITALSTALAPLRTAALSPVSSDLATLDAIGLTMLRSSESVGGSVTTYP